MTSIDQLLDRLDQERRDLGLSKAAVARRAGLHVNTLRHFGEKAWSPTVETIRAVEAAIASGGGTDTTSG